MIFVVDVALHFVNVRFYFVPFIRSCLNAYEHINHAGNRW